MIIFNNMIKVPSYPSLSLEKIDIVFNNNSIKDNVQFFDKVNPNLIKKIEIDDDMNVIKISTVNSTNIQDDTEIYINNKKASKKEMDKLKPDEIERMDVNKASSGKNVIKIITKKKN